MREQRTLAMITGFEQYTKKTRRAIFLEEMEQVVPWRELGALLEPRYPKPGNVCTPGHEEDAARDISGGDGAGGAVARVGRAIGAAVSQAWERADAGGSGADAADLLFAAVVQPVGPGGRRGAVRLGGAAAVRGH